MILSVVATIGLTFLLMKIYTRHDKYIETPDLTGLTLPKAMYRYKDVRFHIDSTAKEPNELPLAIMEQNPLPGDKIKKNRTIYITVNPIAMPNRNVPNIYGRRLDMATGQLEKRGFNWKILRFENDRADSTILKMIYIEPSGDSIVLKNRGQRLVPEGSTIHLVVARGLGEEVLLPDLVCNTYDVANFLLEGTDLKIGTVLTNEIVTDTLNAYVVKTNPTFTIGRKIKKGSEIDIWLSNTPPPNCEIDADFIDDGDTSSTDNTLTPSSATPDGNQGWRTRTGGTSN